MHRAAVHRRHAFSLLELVIVVVVIGIIASIAVTRVSRAAENARVNSATETTRRIQMKLEEAFALEGAWPATIDPAWLPTELVNPLLPNQSVRVQVVALGEAATDPSLKEALTPGDPMFWYNQSNGAFRALVPHAGSAAATLALYNRVNNVTLTGGVPDSLDGQGPVNAQVTNMAEDN